MPRRAKHAAEPNTFSPSRHSCFSRARPAAIPAVADIRNVPLGQEIEPTIYFSTRHYPFSELFYVVRATDTATARAALHEALAAVAPDVPLGDVRTWGDRFAGRTAEARLLMAVLVAFGTLAALLAAIGIYGLFSRSIALRLRELSIRAALGATPQSLGLLVLRQAALLVTVGVLAGALSVRAVGRLLAHVLYQTSPRDLAASGIAAGLLVAAALVATLYPLARAMNADPISGLRSEASALPPGRDEG